MRRDPEFLLTFVLLGSVLALGLAAAVAGRPRPAPRKRWSDAELRRRFPAVYDRMRKGARW